MEIDQDIPQYNATQQNQNNTQQSQKTPSQPVMSQQQAQQGYQSASNPNEQYDTFFKSKVKSYRLPIVILAILQVLFYLFWPITAGIITITILGEDAVFAIGSYSMLSPMAEELINMLSWVGITISIIILIALIYFATMDAKKNTGNNPVSTGVLVFFLGFLGAFIYLLSTIRKQGKAAKKEVQQAPPKSNSFRENPAVRFINLCLEKIL